MDMIAMLAGLGGPTDMWQSNSGGGYTPSLNKTSSGSSGGSYGSTYLRNTGGGKSGASVSGQTVDQYLASKGLAQDLPALAKPAKPVADAPYIAGQSKQAFLDSISLTGGIPTADSLIQNARNKVRQWATTGGLDEQKRRRARLLEALLRGRSVIEDGIRANVFDVQMARDTIIELTTATGEKFFDEVRIKASDAAKNDFGYFGNMKGIAKIVFDAAASDADAIVLLRSFVAQSYAPQALVYPNLAGLDAAGWPKLFDEIKTSPAAVIIGVAYRIVATQFGKTGKYQWTAFANQIPLAIAEGLVLRDYKAKADQAAAWNEAKARYDVRFRKYLFDFNNWQKREDYRSRRIKAIEDYWTAFGKEAEKSGDKQTKDAADAKAREEKARKDKEDADRSLRESQEANQKLQDKLGELEQTIKDLNNAASTGDSAAVTEAKALIDALKAEIDQLKKDLVDAQNAAAEAARNANQNASGGGGGGGGGFVTTDTSQSAADATQAATDATQIAVDALQQTGETVTFKPPTEKKGGSGMLLLLGAVAVGGYFWWRSRRPARPSLMP